MSKKVIISAPVDTYSGYGARARDIVKALIKTKPDWDIKIQSMGWGTMRMGFLDNEGELDIKSRILMEGITYVPDVWIQISVPNEFQARGRFNIGITAGMETTLVHNSWIEGCNRMDLILTSSNHSKETFLRSEYAIEDRATHERVGLLKIEKPLEVLFEGLDLDTYGVKPEQDFDLSSIPEKFLFLVVGHWLQGAFGEDRKNISYTIKLFLETFKGKSNPPALLLKTGRAGVASILDEARILGDIASIREKVSGDKLPNIYLLHGEVSDEEINQIYQHPKVKAMVSLTKGEGFGRPLLEFTTSGKPIIASGWSGQLDFLDPTFTFLVKGELKLVHPSAVVKDMILPQAAWFNPDPVDARQSLLDVFENYSKAQVKGKRLGFMCRNKFSMEKMGEELGRILDEHLPEILIEEVKVPKKKKGVTPVEVKL